MTSQHAQTQTEKTDDANLPAGTATTQAEAEQSGKASAASVQIIKANAEAKTAATA